MVNQDFSPLQSALILADFGSLSFIKAAGKQNNDRNNLEPSEKHQKSKEPFASNRQ